MSPRIFIEEKPVVKPHFRINRIFCRHPMQCSLHLAHGGRTSASAFGIGIVSTVYADYPSVFILVHTLTTYDISAFQTDFSSGCQSEKFLGSRLHKVVPFYVYTSGKAHLPATSIRSFGIIFNKDFLGFSFGIIIDDYFHGQGENLDAESRFAVDLYTQCGFNEIAFGEADVLARAKNVAMNRLQEAGIVNAAKGKVRLQDRDELPAALADGDSTWICVQILVRELAEYGIEGCAKLLARRMSGGEGIKNLAYRLYQIADKKGWAQEGTGYNDLVISWTDIMMRREALRKQSVEAITLDF